MDTISYITNSEGKRTGLIVNLADTAEGKILDYWLREPKEKRKNLSLYLAKFLYEMVTNQDEKKELKRLITHISQAEDSEEDRPYVAYTTDGKGLTEKEYTELIMQASDDVHNEIGLIEIDEVERRLDKKIASYESSLV